MSKRQKIIIIFLSLWAVSMWGGYWYKMHDKNQRIEQALYHKISDGFWEWESAARLRLIDDLLDNPDIVQMRRAWGAGDDIDLIAMAKTIMKIQNKAYGFDGGFNPARVALSSMRGDANGVYIANDKALYINNNIQWQHIDFERFVGVVLHENMHHILTNMYRDMDEDNKLYQDFETFAYIAAMHDELGQKSYAMMTDNTQEKVAYQTERAARYAALNEANLSVWQITTRMQEIRVLREEAGL